MSVDKLDFQNCLLYEFHSKKNATHRCNISICLLYGDNPHDFYSNKRSFARFYLLLFGDFDLNQNDRPGRPTEARVYSQQLD